MQTRFSWCPHLTRLMTVREVADYLSLKERKVYALAKSGAIPGSRVAGKWLFPQDLVDRWVGSGLGVAMEAQPTHAAAPPVVGGSHDPLLEWALRESQCGLALMAGGSRDGLRRLAASEVMVCGTHLPNPGGEGYNTHALQAVLGHAPVVLLQWAWRQQGIVLAPGNPLGITGLEGLATGGDSAARVILREEAAGTHALLQELLAARGLGMADLRVTPRTARTQTEVGLAIMAGDADAGVAVESVARQLKLDFVPLRRERYDLALRRRDYFEPPFQKLMAFARSAAFAEGARAMAGYDTTGLGTVIHNGP